MTQNKKAIMKSNPLDELKSTLQKMEPQFQIALPKHIPADKFVRILQTAVSSNPKLVDANRTSLFTACMSAAEQGVWPDGRESAIVPYKGEAKLIVMFQGILKKVRNSGELLSIDSQIVYENDEFDFWSDETGQHIKHRPNLIGERGPRCLCYATARTKDGGVYIEVMTETEIQDVKNTSRAKDTGPWNGAFENEMVRKTVIRRLSKRLPMSTDLDKAIHDVDEFYDLKTEEYSKPALTKSNRLTKLIEPETQEEKTKEIEIENPFNKNSDEKESSSS